MIRVDKMTYLLLQETLVRYQNGDLENILLWKIILQDRKDLSARVSRIMKKIGHGHDKKYLSKTDTEATFGGGSLPGMRVPSCGITIELPDVTPEELYTRFINSDIPVIGSIIEDRYTIDFMTVLDDDIPGLTAAIESILEGYESKAAEQNR